MVAAYPHNGESVPWARAVGGRHSLPRRSRIRKALRKPWFPLRWVRRSAIKSEILMTVSYEIKLVSETCGSVRSSLSAPTRLGTVAAEAAETSSLHLHGEEMSVRTSPRLRASMRSE